MPSLADLYREAEAAAIPVTIHAGTSVFPGARSRLGDPMDVDDVAVDFPKLEDPARPWGSSALDGAAFFVVQRHPNVFLEVSASRRRSCWSGFPRLEEIAHKTVWGADWPSPGVKSMRQNVERFLALPLGEEAKRRILYDNAAGIF